MEVRLEGVLASISPTDVENRLIAALDADETDRATALVRLASERNIGLPSNLIARFEAQQDEASSLVICIKCALNAEECPDFARVAACNLPAELTPVGDISAVGRALTATATGKSIDTVDLSLALVGLAATGAIVISVGTSATVKAGATILRVARRSKALGPKLSREVNELASRSLRLERAGDVAKTPTRWGELIDKNAIGALVAVTADAGRLSTQMPVGDALAVMKGAESAQDLAILTRVGDVAGAQTRGAIDVLGKGRVLRTGKRLSEVAMATIALLLALAGQILAFIVWWLRRLLQESKKKNA